MPDFLFLKTGLLLPVTLSPDTAPHKDKEQFPSFNVKPTWQCQTAGDRLGEGGQHKHVSGGSACTLRLAALFLQVNFEGKTKGPNVHLTFFSLPTGNCFWGSLMLWPCPCRQTKVNRGRLIKEQENQVPFSPLICLTFKADGMKVVSSTFAREQTCTRTSG